MIFVAGGSGCKISTVACRAVPCRAVAFPSPSIFLQKACFYHLNVTRFFQDSIVTRAAAEYILDLARDPAADTWDDPETYMAKAAPNVNFEWLTQYLHNAGFYNLEFIDAVRGYESHTIDLLWREFFASAHTDTAHKTQYVGMAILCVF